MPHQVILLANPSSVMEMGKGMAPSDCVVHIVPPGSPNLREMLPDTEYIIGYGRTVLADDFYTVARKLKLIQLLSAGYDVWDIERAKGAGVAIATNGGANSTAVAEHTMMQMLALNRRLIQQHANILAGKWADLGPRPLRELDGRTLGIVGLGSIGKKVARLTRAFGMHVLYYDTTRLAEDVEDALGLRFRIFDELLRVSDIVSLHVPLIPATLNLIGARELEIMKPTAFLLNTCRGPLIDETALYEALKGGKIGGAALDVYVREPPSIDNPLLSLDNVLLTPHMAGPTAESWPKRFRNTFDNIQRSARGEEPLWVVPELRRQ